MRKLSLGDIEHVTNLPRRANSFISKIFTKLVSLFLFLKYFSVPIWIVAATTLKYIIETYKYILLQTTISYPSLE